MKKILLLLLFPFICNAQLGLDPIPPYTICEPDTEGFAVFDLNSHIEEILSPENYNWEFYLDPAAIDAGTSISESGLYTNITAYQQTIYVVVTNPESDTSQTMPFNLVVANAPSSHTLSPVVQCDYDQFNDGISIFDLTVINDQAKGICAECIVSFYTTNNDVEIDNPENFNNTSNPQILHVLVTSLGPEGCASWTTLTLEVLLRPNTNPLQPLITIDTDNNPTDGKTEIDLTILGTSISDDYDPQYYHLHFFTSDNNMPITDPTSYTASNGETLYYILDSITTTCTSSGNIEIIILPQDYETPPPIGVTEQTFSEGETLADIELEGEDIQWYDNPGEETDFIFTPKNGELPLPLTTLLVNGTTYYASQTIYGIESTNRLAVTVLKTLGINDNQFTGMTYYPNPIKDVLTIVNNNDIETVNIVNMLGQTILNKQINNSTAQMDLSSLQSGVYIVNITSGGKNKTIKVIKE
ncbi:hypothetical protein D3C87_289180 [compost metagenome]